MDNMQLVKDTYAAFGRGDVPAVLGAMSSDIRWHEAESNPYMPSGDAWVGPDAVLNNLFMRIGAEWDGFTIHPHRFHDAGDTIVVEVRYTGKYTATGKTLDAQACHVWDIANGKLKRFQQYVDTSKLLDVIRTSA